MNTKTTYGFENEIMKRLTNGKYVNKGYFYKGYEVRNHGYYPPDRANWWEAINIETGCADHHAHTKRDLKKLIDAYDGK